MAVYRSCVYHYSPILLPHQEVEQRRQNTAQPRADRAGGEARVANGGGEQLGRVDVDGGEGGRDTEPAHQRQTHQRPVVGEVIWEQRAES